MTITTESGRTYELSETAVARLAVAKQAWDANDICIRHAPHIPARQRNEVWQAIPTM